MGRKILNQPRAVEYPIFADDRGVFAPVINGLDKIEPSAGQAKRIYYCFNDTAGIVRGFHYHRVEWKFFFIVQGSAKFIAINPDKPEEKHQFISSARKNNLIIIPPGFANGWVSLAPQTILICASTLTTEESLKDDKRFDPYHWGDLWSVKAR